MSLKGELLRAVLSGSLPRIRKLLEEHPEFDVNGWINEDRGMLHSAAMNNSVVVVSFLLQYPGVDVNRLTSSGVTALGITCRHNNLRVAKVLLEDKRVDLNFGATSADGPLRTCNPLLLAMNSQSVEIVRHLMACGRPLDVPPPESLPPIQVLPAPWPAEVEIRRLLAAYTAHPIQATHEARVALDMPPSLAAVLFAHLIFLADDLFLLKKIAPCSTFPSTQRMRNTERFFTIALCLPLEVQMILCLRVHGCQQDIVRTEDSEPAFRALAKLLLPPHD